MARIGLDIIVAHKTIPGGGRSVSNEQYFELVDRVIAARTGALPRSTPPVMAPYDVVLTNARIVDGTGAPAYSGDVAILGRQIVRVSTARIPRDSALRVIDVKGHVLAPGFIDMHAHLEPLLGMPDAQSAARQGVTLALGGPDGGGPWPFGAYLDSADRAGLGINVAYLVGHNTIRREVMGTANRAPTTAELDRMTQMVGQAMHEGAFGISTGLRYIPGFYSKTDEVVSLSKVAADSGGIYTSHLREEGLGLFEGIAEASRSGDRPTSRSCSRTTRRSDRRCGARASLRSTWSTRRARRVQTSCWTGIHTPRARPGSTCSCHRGRSRADAPSSRSVSRIQRSGTASPRV
jgi:N-acyl-D-aspartate/D-glutamate deacylase